MRRRCSFPTVILLAAAALVCWRADSALAAGAAATQPAVDPRAEQILRQACDVLAASKQFTFTAHSIVEQSLRNGQKVQFAKNMKASVRRPAGLEATVAGDLEDQQLQYDGKRLGIFLGRDNVFGTAGDVPATNDATLDLLAEKYGLVIPLADLVFADPYKVLTERLMAGEYLGKGYVDDDVCHHLAFRQETVDWEVWILAGDKPLVRKIVITYKSLPSWPQYTAFLSDWNLSANLPERTFTPVAPAGAKEVPLDTALVGRGASSAAGAPVSPKP
jgi:hypothetical protein